MLWLIFEIDYFGIFHFAATMWACPWPTGLIDP